MTLTVVADENIPSLEEYLGKRARVLRVKGRELRPAQLAQADALLVRSVTPVDERLLQDSPVRFVGSATSGTDHVDRAWLSQQGISFAHAPGSNANSVVEYVLAAICGVDDYIERLLAGGSLGIVGFGVIGRAVTACFRNLGIAVRVSDPWLDQADIPHAASLADVLACDVIAVHAELAREQPWPSYHLLGAEEVASLGHDQLLINASRGAIVDNAALRDVLQGGSGPQVVLDVWEGEPEFDVALLDLVRIGTAHIAGYSLDGKILATRMLCEAMHAAGLSTKDPESYHGLSLPPIEAREMAGECGAFIRQLLRQRYEIERDDALLRGIAGHPGRRGAEFDRLRREYAERRELRGSLLQVPELNAEQAKLAAALGCRLETGSQNL